MLLRKIEVERLPDIRKCSETALLVFPPLSCFLMLASCFDQFISDLQPHHRLYLGDIFRSKHPTFPQLSKVEAPSCYKMDDLTFSETLHSYQLWEYCSVLSYVTFSQCETSYDPQTEYQCIVKFSSEAAAHIPSRHDLLFPGLHAHIASWDQKVKGLS